MMTRIREIEEEGRAMNWEGTISALPDGLYQVETDSFCAGFEVKKHWVIKCAPILRKRFHYWEFFALRVCAQ
jgi:hypothetical protein